MKTWWKVWSTKFHLDRERMQANRARKVGSLIADFYLERHKDKPIEEQYEQARQEIVSLGISGLAWKSNVITVTLSRPGLLIGRHGDNIKALEMFLKERLPFKHLNIEEDTVLWSLYPHIPEHDFDVY